MCSAYPYSRCPPGVLAERLPSAGAGAENTLVPVPSGPSAGRVLADRDVGRALRDQRHRVLGR